MSVGSVLMSVNRTSIYYEGTPVSEAELACKAIIDRLHTENPSWGARQMSAQLKLRGYHIGRKKARRYMNEMGIENYEIHVTEGPRDGYEYAKKEVEKGEHIRVYACGGDGTLCGTILSVMSLDDELRKKACVQPFFCTVVVLLVAAMC